MTVKTEKLRKWNDKAKNKNFSLLEEGSAPVVLIDGFNQFSSFLQSPFFSNFLLNPQPPNLRMSSKTY